MKKKTGDDELAKLVRLTKLLKTDKVKVTLKGPVKSANKWRSSDAKFAPKAEKPVDLVQAGGMEVDPARQEEYENWRNDKIEEQNYRRIQAAKRAKMKSDAEHPKF